MSGSKQNAIFRLASSIIFLLTFAFLIPSISFIWTHSQNSEIQFHWWDKTSFLLGLCGFLFANFYMGLTGIRDLNLKESN